MKIKVMFVHNSIPEYRIEFWKKLGEICTIKLVITRKDLEQKIYGFEKDTENLDIVYWSNEILKEIGEYDVIVLPPVDAVKEYLIGKEILKAVKGLETKAILWTEKWELKTNKKNYIKQCKNFVQRCMIADLAHKVNICVAAGSRSKLYLEKIGIQEAKIHIAYDSSTSPWCLDKIDFLKEYGIPKNAKVILFFGRVIERKGLLYLIKAFEKYKTGSEYLLVCGEGESLDNCKKYVSDQRVDNVVFAGKIQPYLREQYYKRADVFVLPSYCYKGIIEAWGLTVNEALQCGTPVIATNVVGAAYDLIDDKCGKVIQEASVEEILTALNEVLDKKKIDAGYCKTIAEKYSVDNMAREFYSAIAKCKKNI